MEIAILTQLWALSLDLTFGDLPNRFHPVAGMGAFIRWADMNCRVSSKQGQFIYGMFLTILGGVLFSCPWFIFSIWLSPFSILPNIILTGLCLKPVFTIRGLIHAGHEIQAALVNNDLPGAQKLVSWHLVSRSTDILTTGEVASAVIESLAENLTDSFLAPIFFFYCLGLPAAWFYRFVNTADAMIGYHTTRYEYLGKFSAKLDDLLNWLPTRLGAVALVLAAGICQCDVGAAWRLMIEQHKLTSSPNAGWTMAAAAGALGVRLSKRDHYVLNSEQPLPDEKDISRAIQLLTWAALISVVFLIGGLTLGLSFFN
ncbi:MAG: adenosylcobinamide-phosphate synthase CbiB [Chloroflexota bacterium]